jgi:hypothetical protein
VPQAQPPPAPAALRSALLQTRVATSLANGSAIELHASWQLRATRLQRDWPLTRRSANARIDIMNASVRDRLKSVQRLHRRTRTECGVQSPAIAVNEPGLHQARKES